MFANYLIKLNMATELKLIALLMTDLKFLKGGTESSTP